MALLSFAGSPHGGSLKLLPEYQSQPRITPRLIIDHTIVGSALGAFWYFHDQTGIESHFIVRGRESGAADGHIWQLVDTDHQADANLEANNKAISIETEDNGEAPIESWSPAQLASLKWLHNKLVAIHPTILRRKATDCDGPGLGYHSQMGAPSCWTPSAGKTCPTTRRINQWNGELVPAFLHPTQEDDMSVADAQAGAEAAIREIFRVPAGASFDVPQGQLNLQKIFVILADRTGSIVNNAAAVLAAVNAVKAQVGDSKAAVLGALAALDLDLSDADIAEIASAVNVDEAAVAEAVRFRLAAALGA